MVGVDMVLQQKQQKQKEKEEKMQSQRRRSAFEKTHVVTEG